MLRGYITNLGMYNEGFLVGKWIDFPIDEDDLEETLKEIGIDEQYEEWFFTDYECDVNYSGLSEYESIKTLNEIAETLDKYGDVALAYADLNGLKEVLYQNFDNCYLYPGIDDEYDLGEYLINNLEMVEIPKWLESYIDYAKYGENYNINNSGGFTDYGYLDIWN